MIKLFLSLILCLSFSLTQAQNLNISKTLIDLGQLESGSKRVEFEYEISNSGTTPMLILDVEVSCKCTKVKYSKRPILAGESSIISMSYEPEKTQGNFHKAVQIITNDTQGRYIVAFRGEIF